MKTQPTLIVRVSADRASYTLPDRKVDRETYSIPPISTLIGAISSIHDKPSILWQVAEFGIVKVGVRETTRTNETSKKHREPAIMSENRTQRLTTYMRDVEYILKISVKILALDNDCEDEHQQMQKCLQTLERRIKKGQFYRQPYLGSSICQAKFRLVDPSSISILGPDDIGPYLVPGLKQSIATRMTKIDCIVEEGNHKAIYRHDKGLNSKWYTPVINDQGWISPGKVTKNEAKT